MPGEGIEKHREEVAYFMRRLYKKGLTTSLGGNISTIYAGSVLMTPSSVDKARVKGKHIGIFSSEGVNMTPEIKATIEAEMHLSVYRHRPDVKAIIHAHPPLASSFTATDKKIDCTLIAESRCVLGEPAVAPYALMGTNSLAEEVSRAAAFSNVILMKNHGVVCLGENLISAFNRVEVLEAAARMTIVSFIAGGCISLTLDQLKELDALLK